MKIKSLKQVILVKVFENGIITTLYNYIILGIFLKINYRLISNEFTLEFLL